jgi:hypothetical protein
MLYVAPAQEIGWRGLLWVAGLKGPVLVRPSGPEVARLDIPPPQAPYSGSRSMDEDVYRRDGINYRSENMKQMIMVWLLVEFPMMKSGSES